MRDPRRDLVAAERLASELAMVDAQRRTGIATGKVTSALKPRYRHQEFPAFLKQVAWAYPEGELHL